MYIYNLPYIERKELCNLLDHNGKWEELAGKHMKFDVPTVQTLKREMFRSSPTDELLTLWGNHNHSVLELFILLHRMEQYQAMNIIKKFIDDKYHTLIKNYDDHLHNMLLKCELENQDEKSQKILNVPKELVDRQVNGTQTKPEIVSREDNESTECNEKNLLQPRSPLPLGKLSKAVTASDISVVAESAGAIPQILYEDLKKSTNNWSVQMILGRGGFGTVFKGTWKCTKVAIKRIEQRDDNPESHVEQIKQSITELHCLNTYRHDNILPLYGYSIGGPQPCLVYQYMSGGSLEYRLRTKDPTKLLSWTSRLNIAIGSARGLQFLHTIGDKPLIHGDIKPANILLDSNDTPRIGDFGLAKEGPHNDYTHIKLSRIHGTRPYLPDEFLRAKKFSTKVDTFSFGVVLFELATAQSAYSDKRENKFLTELVGNYEGDILDLKDEKVEGGDAIFLGLVRIGKECVSKKAKDRPEMVSVLIKLENI